MSNKKAPQSKIPVHVNVYDLAKLNEYLFYLNMGVFHSGVEVLGREFSFGGHDFAFSGVFEVIPRKAPAAIFRHSVHIGDIEGMEQKDVESLIDAIKPEYPGNSYNLVTRNCNHFTDDLCQRLVNKSIPKYINRLANLGVFFNCMLPDSWGVNATGPISAVTRPISVTPTQGSMSQGRKHRRPSSKGTPNGTAELPKNLTTPPPATTGTTENAGDLPMLVSPSVLMREKLAQAAIVDRQETSTRV
mmetsp:Transcript_20781/g.34251  ORF Transcript_20781/g.34251 Transcript_20781/m.34251 type:complete len:245 (+) Transcript_20781:141-875(+)|eukprot:CAMPEP_0184664434 /NCGR_PEP_ID=MMETSP0308-20130426/52790_1 /TAXON_ID=38269 /ORGANISM="Gloeochaete witrockiana, Strain SAG 46.84" /LENGTH=244 /DNA_ID=CAMNT_0027107823 /DNA_START=102 /DNA_END=836 /DNA_ORIENTATION=+